MAQFSAAAGNGPDLHICCASPTHCRGRADPHLQSAAPDTATGTALLGAALPRELQEGTRCPGRSCYHTGALPQPSAAPEQAEQSPTERPTAVLSVCRRETSLSTAWLPKANAHLRLLPHPQCCVLRGDSTAGTRCYGDTVLWGHGAMGTRCYMGCAVQGRRAKAVCEWGSHIHRCNASTARNPSAASAWHTHSSAHEWIKASLCIYLVGRYLTWGSRLQAARSPPPSHHTTSAPLPAGELQLQPQPCAALLMLQVRPRAPRRAPGSSDQEPTHIPTHVPAVSPAGQDGCWEGDTGYVVQGSSSLELFCASPEPSPQPR